MKIYIAGKITGDPNYKEKFKRAEDYLVTYGHTVLNPSVLPYDLSASDYTRICIAMMECADLVLFLPDYKESPGALLELQWCKYTYKSYDFLSKLPGLEH